MSELTFVDALNTAVPSFQAIQRVIEYSICTNITLPKTAQIEGNLKYCITVPLLYCSKFQCMVITLLAGELPYYAFFVELAVEGETDEETLEKELSAKVRTYRTVCWLRGIHSSPQVALVAEGPY